MEPTPEDSPEQVYICTLGAPPFLEEITVEVSDSRWSSADLVEAGVITITKGLCFIYELWAKRVR